MIAAVAAALFAALALPLLFILAESAAQWAPIATDDFEFAYTLGAPFALAVALAVAWPAFAFLPNAWPPGRKVLVGVAICFAVPVIAIWPSAGEFPWKGGLAGSATFLLWSAAYRFIRRLMAGAIQSGESRVAGGSGSVVQ